MERDQPISPNLDETEAEGEGLGAEDGPESQGELAGEAFEEAHGQFDDEDFDPSYTARRPQHDVEERLAADLRDRIVDELDLDPADITVSVADGTALLDGLVDDLAYRDTIEQMALDTPGVRAIENRIRQRRGPDAAE